MMVIGLSSLLAGMVVNQFIENGISWQILFWMHPADNDIDVVTILSAESAYLLWQDPETLFIDVRSEDDFHWDHIPGALSVPAAVFYRNPDTLRIFDQDKKTILYDFDPSDQTVRSMARYAKRRGIQQVFVLHGGFSEWLQMAYPVEKGSEQ